MELYFIRTREGFTWTVTFKSISVWPEDGDSNDKDLDTVTHLEWLSLKQREKQMHLCVEGMKYEVKQGLTRYTSLDQQDGTVYTMLVGCY